MEVTQKTLREIGAGAIPQIIVYNKADLVGLSDLPRIVDNKIFMAAAPEVGITELAELVRNTLYAGNEECTFLFPYEKGGEASRLMEIANVASTEYLPEGIRIKASCTKREVMRYSEFATIQSHARK